MSLFLDVLVPQLARPHGALSKLVAPLLDRGNRTINLHVVGALDLKPQERVLEVGFGGGVGLAMVLTHEPDVVLSGMDLSPEMLVRCQKRFGQRVTLAQGSVESLPYPDAAFDKLFGVNVSYFWPNLERALSELRRVLAPNGLLVLGVRPPEVLRKVQFDVAGHRVWSAQQYLEALAAAGFVDTNARRVPDPSGAWLVTARRG
jgi:arsenite methyltransferase